MNENENKAVSEKTISEMGESLNGFEEIAVQTHFGGKTLAQLLGENPTMGIRALIFTDVHRDGETNVQASKQQVMEMRLKDVMDYFTEDNDDDDDLDHDLDDVDPFSALGKAEPESAPLE